ncbi:MAG TPA: aminotransferase class I/II-fold pyridoxal phosphate-dependent enzyme [Fermentimonas caenicola]|jgi:LL-diaminopimelate aminotransferase|uniref:Aminotransferase n=1 Tax=Fermentimonas caenicola TaxID=1562970 RepID=A0A098C2X8_9BACT|nr:MULTISPECIES: aminotransferase class I/II-fold pyridoxal phosphate-dependent enzyme [Lascolabacillus]MBP7103780.1 aminotransferase class I/II-fold pyridoxal phosphate-dependent enzyme [Fermentimonas sp.]MDI9625852.1 aminotransferase class I/II-fold pyridoxal phosphate-dependent enzyme [Bacteroidota bacterium]TAH62286.1 MAG: aminotransferase class I/II-fold pyridoxal phosphate-dependent enzyme [Fermentimonas caenicola]MDD2606987.1 aminotransferase class I/II-fold pyridoxal phosphate-dependent
MSIEPAEHIKSISEYYFSVKLAEVARMNAEGKNVISLAVGAPDRMPSQLTIETLCLSAQRPDVHAYQPYTGIPELRKAYAGWYKRFFNVDLSVDEVLPLIGSKEGILHISMTFLNVGDGVLVPNPGYPTYRSVSNLLRAKVIEYDLLEDDGWYPDFDALEKMDLSGVKLMWVNYPNMPTGAKGSTELFEKLVAFGKKHEIIICHDNPYSFILNDKPMSILSVPGAKDICIELNSLSKSHNMSGWRMGMLSSNAQFVKWVLKAKSNIDSGQFKPMQLATVAALSNSDEWHTDMNRIYAERRVWAEKIMDLLNCRYDKSQVGLFVWGKLPDEVSGSEEFINDILYKANVFITPGFIFGSNGERFIRISLGSSVDLIKEAYRRIENKIKTEN